MLNSTARLQSHRSYYRSLRPSYTGAEFSSEGGHRFFEFLAGLFLGISRVQTEYPGEAYGMSQTHITGGWLNARAKFPPSIISTSIHLFNLARERLVLGAYSALDNIRDSLHRTVEFGSPP